MGRPRIHSSDAERQRAFRARRRLQRQVNPEECSDTTLRSTTEERAQFLSALVPFDSEAWMREVTPASPEELAALEEFLAEREEARQESLERERLTLGE